MNRWSKWLAVVLLLGATLCVGVWHAQKLRFFCDDSYISYRYSQNFANGNGLVYNAGGDFGGPRVEGYTNFFWVLLLGLAMKMGFAAEPASLWLGVAFLVVTIAATTLLTRRLSGSWAFACVPGLLLVSQGPAILWSVSGLEASCFAATTVLALLAYERGFASPRALFGAGLLYALSTTVRPDGVVFGAAAGLHLALCGLAARPLDVAALVRRAAALAAGFLALFAPFVLWRHWYYGDWLPNTFYVKAGGRVNARLGFDYLAHWFGEYWLAGSLALAGLLAAFTLPMWRERRRTFVHLALALLLFAGYLVWAGGDYMALYRFMAPLLPLAAVASVALLQSLFVGLTKLRLRPIYVGAKGLAALGGVAWLLVQPTQRSLDGKRVSNAISSVAGMAGNSRQWAILGKQLHGWKERLPKDFTIATTAAGALPYFAEMRTIDQSGLCDRHTAKVESDPWMLDRPGHMKQATTRWIGECKPHLVFWHPQIFECGTGPRSQPPTADYEARALDVPEFAEDGECVYCWVRKDMVPLLEPLGVVALKDSASLSTKEESGAASSSDAPTATSAATAGRHRKKSKHETGKEAFEAQVKAELAKLDDPGLPPAPTVDPPLPAPYHGPVFTSQRVHAADPTADEPRLSVGDVSRPVWNPERNDLEIAGEAGSFLEFDVTSAPLTEVRDVVEEGTDEKGEKTTVHKKVTVTKQLPGAVVPKSIAVAFVANGARHDLATSTSEPPFAGSRCWRHVHVELGGAPAGKGTLEVAVDGKPLGKGGGWLASVPRICQRSEAAAPKKRPNVLILTIDTLRADYLGCYGHDRPTSPNVDAFAKTAVLFEHDVAQAPWTLPSYSSFFTGLYCESHGVVHRDHKLGASFATFLEKLAQSGYATAGVVSGTFTDAHWGFDQGFDSYDDLGMVVDESHPDQTVTASGAAPTDKDAMEAAAHRRVTSPEVANKAIAWLDAHRDQRFALFVHFFDPHADFLFHPGVSEKFPPRSPPKDFPNAVDRTPDVSQKMRARYEGEIAYTDVHVGRVLARLEQLGLADDTIVVLFGDHGEAFNEHALDPEDWHRNFGHGGSLFNEQVHVPLIVRAPGFAPGRVASPTGTIDVGPTLLDLCGVDDSDWKHQGQSLRPMLEDKSARRDGPVLTALYRMLPEKGLEPTAAAENRVQTAHRVDQDLCAIEFFAPGGKASTKFLFDVADPWQDYGDNLLVKGSDAGAKERFAATFQRMNSFYANLRKGFEALLKPATIVETGSQIRRTLNGLGYADGEDDSDGK